MELRTFKMIQWAEICHTKGWIIKGFGPCERKKFPDSTMVALVEPIEPGPSTNTFGAGTIRGTFQATI
ncbi:uncharacterized protein EAF01_011879 [Botrytis porri]|uniref:Uncharacterized protein n=1 Tax=Botrytis porri TaxID=87229 RepID=A0A4Z1KEH4_9HELO|nr:uncharacterized protein EAF01_011879 [Botrytis porri]KAF7881368.1 hypothetical protein EAF01_011879 [Botrytis porri]TGO82592.1 hypothetical protein BPOR_0797g00030 [Botrytis porri]